MPTLEITTMVGCPLKCTFCPQDKLRTTYGANQKYLSLENFRTILSKVPKHVRIDFAGMSEPWANPQATAMLEHALKQGYDVTIYSTLYGISPEDGDRILALLQEHARQITILCLHLPDKNSNMRGWRYSKDWENVLLKMLQLGLSGALPNFQAMTMDGSGELHPDLAHLGLQLGPWLGHTRAGNVTEKDVPGQVISGRPRYDAAVSCAYTPFYDQNVCLPNGDVVLCCMDYSVKHRIGNLLEQDYYDMFASQLFAGLMAENMRPQFSEKSLCKSCDRALEHTVHANKQMWSRLPRNSPH